MLVTDGVTEARAGRGQELFGDERLTAVLCEHCGDRDTDGIVEEVMDTVEQHTPRGFHADESGPSGLSAGRPGRGTDEHYRPADGEATWSPRDYERYSGLE